MLKNYFQYRTKLAKKDCLLQCPKACEAPGCRSPDVIVEVTIFDLIGLGRALDASVSSLFSRHCRLGLQAIKHNPRYRRLLLKLLKPCHFNQKMRCAVHDSKPLNCVLFPEYHQIRNILSTFKTPSIFSEFQCLDGNITISNKRRHALLTLRKMNRIEEAVSCYFLFGTPSFIIDAKPINRELKRNLSQTDTVSPQKYDDFAVKKLKHIGFFNRFMENLAALDAYDGIERIFEICNHGDLVSLLVEQATTQNTIFAFKRDGFKKRKRQLAPRSFTHLIFLLPEFTPLGNRR